MRTVSGFLRNKSEGKMIPKDSCLLCETACPCRLIYESKHDTGSYGPSDDVLERHTFYVGRLNILSMMLINTRKWEL